MMTDRVKIKCRDCGTIFYQDMFQEKGAGASCKCKNLSIRALEAAETRFGYWFTVEYSHSAPTIVEKRLTLTS